MDINDTECKNIEKENGVEGPARLQCCHPVTKQILEV